MHLILKLTLIAVCIGIASAETFDERITRFFNEAFRFVHQIMASVFGQIAQSEGEFGDAVNATSTPTEVTGSTGSNGTTTDRNSTNA